MKKMMLLIFGLICIAICAGSIAQETTSGSGLTTLKQDSAKNASDMNVSLFSIIDEFGVDGLNVGEAVKFTAPKSGWKLYGVKILGWSDFNSTDLTYPMDRNFLLEIRDKDLRLLYRFADIQNGYFLADQGPVYGNIEVPALPITGEFYVVFYDRGGMVVAMETDSGTGNSFLFSNGDLQPAQLTTATNETIDINWIVEALGK